MKKRTIQIYISAIVIILVILFFLFNKKISADSNQVEEKFRVVINSQEVNFSLIGSKSLTKLEYRDKSNKIKSISISNTPEELKICPESFYKSGMQNTFLCLVGDVGVHSQEARIFSYEGGDFKLIPFDNQSVSSDGLLSDLPNFEIDDLNSDGLADISAYSRDYDGDPLIDSIKNTFIQSSGRFNFVERNLVKLPEEGN